MESKEIRETFLNFFKANDHQLITGSSIIPKNDPTLLFINSGMAPLKEYFLNLKKPPYPRLANVQPCIRTNDIEDVGDRHHLTFFEMLGSWSIGDYYKEKAIGLAYDLLVNHFHFPPEKLYATVYKGNPALNIPADEESIRCWKKAGMPADHIVSLGDDNFWGPAGDTGPCGPCTEVFFDTGEEYGIKYVPGGHFDDKSRYIEIWNAGVFMELNKDKEGNFSPLPMKSVDTGSGIERMYLALNKCESLYDVDTIRPIYDVVKNILNITEITERDIRMVTDHLRTTTILLGEGVIPGREGRGYIARRLIRKSAAMASRAKKPASLLKAAIEETIGQMGDWYPHLAANRATIIRVFEEEIADFEPVIKAGLELLSAGMSKMEGKLLAGDFVFELVATHGIPLEIITDFAGEKGFSVDQEGYQKEYRKHQDVSRSGIKEKIATVEKGGAAPLQEMIAKLDKTKFVGNEKTVAEATVVKIISEGNFVDEVSAGQKADIIFNQTPFYGESGGQVGDKGTGSNTDVSITINDTQKIKGVFIHASTIEKGTVKLGDTLTIGIDETRRKDINKNHSATHLLHASLRNVLGPHVVQKGSLVNENKLRFDFQHNKPVADEELKKVEWLVNNWIWNNYKTDITEMNYQEAIASGAMALFSENYGDRVRVVKMGDVSAELCGGTHVANTGEIGTLFISQENSVGKGVRRIEAVTGRSAYNQANELRNLVKSASSLLVSAPENLLQNIQKLKAAPAKEEKKPNEDNSAPVFVQEKNILLANGKKAFAGQVDRDLTVLQKIATDKINAQGYDLVFLLSTADDSIKNIVLTKEDAQKDYPADALLKKWIVPFGGKGGGKPAQAKGGIADKSNAEAAFKAIEDVLK